jgi:alkylation response protein AidB-like acyl-CoA dehydrogenase
MKRSSHSTLVQAGDRNPPVYDREKDIVTHMPEQVEAMKRYKELGFLGLLADYEHGGSQVPVHIAALARLPFTTANVGLGGTYVDLSNGEEQTTAFEYSVL